MSVADVVEATNRRIPMIRSRRSLRILSLVAGLAALATISLQLGAAAQEEAATRPVVPTVTIRQLKGTWFATLSGVTGCGTTTYVATFTLDATGNGTQTSATEHTAGCGDIDQSGQSAQVQSLSSNGSGFVALGCGVGCGFGFNIQVSRDHNSFNMGPQPVTGNYLAGISLRR